MLSGFVITMSSSMAKEPEDLFCAFPLTMRWHEA